MNHLNVGDRVDFKLGFEEGVVDSGTIQVIYIHKEEGRNYSTLEVLCDRDERVWTMGGDEVVVTQGGAAAGEELSGRLLFDNAAMLEEIVEMKDSLRKSQARVHELLTANDQLEDEKGELQEEMEELNDRHMEQMEESSGLVTDYEKLKQENSTLMKVIQAIAGK